MLRLLLVRNERKPPRVMTRMVVAGREVKERKGRKERRRERKRRNRL